MVPDYLRLTLWEHLEPTGHGEMFYGANNQCQLMPDNIKYKMSNARFEITPDPSTHPTAFVYENNDCTGRYLPVELDFTAGINQLEWDAWDLAFNKGGWSDKGASVYVPDGYRLILWTDISRYGIDDIFYGLDDACQPMSEDLANRMSNLLFEPMPEPVQHPIARIY